MTVALEKTPARQLTVRGAATKTRILEAAADLIYVHGVGGTSLDEVMAASATSKSQLYHYFADKEALISEVILVQTGRVFAAQGGCLHELDTPEGLRRWADMVIEINRASGGIGGCPIGSLASELADKSEDARALLTGSFQTWESYLADGMRAMQQRGELRSDADPGELATAVMAALQGGILLAQTTRTTRPLELALDMALEHVNQHRSER